MYETINDFLCAVEKKEIEIENFNTNNIEIYLSYCRDDDPIVEGDFDSVYAYLDNAQYLDFNVEKVVVEENASTKIYITYLDVEPVLEKVIRIM
jgi:hypothetical protein